MYINAYYVLASYIAEKWTLTPISYINAPSPKVAKSGDYEGCYISLNSSVSTNDRELNGTQIEQGVIRFDIHTPVNSTFKKAEQLVHEVVKLFELNLASCSFWVEDVNIDAGYAPDGTHVARINVNYVTDYLFD